MTKTVVIRSGGQTLCKFFQERDVSSGMWWRLECKPMRQKQISARARNPATGLQGHLRQPKVWRDVVDAHGRRLRRTMIVSHYDLAPGEREFFLFPSPVGRVSGTDLHVVLTQFSEVVGREVVGLELNTLREAIKRQ